MGGSAAETPGTAKAVPGARYYLRHEVGERWWNYPWAAFEGRDYPWGRRLGIAITRRGALRLISRDRKRRQREAVQPRPPVETELVGP